ncbi:MAG TPA: 3-hydroxybutyrate dehydrogenase [Bryobacteraceae bacterium]|jgi:3-hydroxybutyrate dehydrogenase|nr:3-hydroxybutyrate dehydrogenase [Bryobacteraceae bacterium]
MTAINVLQGKCALITGSTQGLGLTAAKRFAAAGCNVIIHGLADEREMDALRADIEKQYGVRTMYCGENLAQTLEIERMIGTILDTFGVIDILVNNAVARYAAPVEQFPAGEWDLAIAVNLSAAFHTIRLALPAMRKRNWGRIINVSSIYGLKATTNRISYVTTKTALIGMTRAIALETRDQDITCNAVCPGTVETPVHIKRIEDMMKSESLTREEAEQRFLATKQPGGRFITTEDVSAMMLFLCGPESRDITGAALPIDGGWSIA